MLSLSLLSVFSILTLAVIVPLHTVAGCATETERQLQFIDWMTEHGKEYETTNELFARYDSWKRNAEIVDHHNLNGESFTMGLNSYSDLSSDEMAGRLNGWRRAVAQKTKLSFTSMVRHSRSKLAGLLKSGSGVQGLVSLAAPPASLDWRTKGAVTPIKDQGQCGSCWAFSATGAMEGAWKLAKNVSFNLSEQQLMDCSGPEGDESCNGGLMDDAFQYVIDANGSSTEECYPYTAQDQPTCNTTCARVVKIRSFTDVVFNDTNPNDDSYLMAAIQHGPVSVAVEADQAVFQLYKSGVINSESCGTDLDHGILLIGYGTDPKYGDYWLIKNSWGTSWGEAGFGKLARGQNECGINQAASYPVV